MKKNKYKILKYIYIKFQEFYTNRFIKPKLKTMGKGSIFIRPWYLKIFGNPINIKSFNTFIATSDKKIRLVVWSHSEKSGYINIGKFCIISPGVRISSAKGIDIKDGCMLANNVYISDCDWHGIYDRISLGKSANIKIEKNVWIGDSSIICKGVTIGKNSVIGAGSVITKSIPANVIAAGNPAKIIRKLNLKKKIKTRKKLYT